MEFFATCPTAFEPLLADELRLIGAKKVRPLQGMVSFGGDLGQAYAACLWSRLASRVVLVLARGGAASQDELYATAADVAWEAHIPAGGTFSVDATGTNAQLRSTKFVAQRVHDAVVDRMQDKVGVRPAVERQDPSVGVVARLSKGRVTLGLDLAGAPLFRRGYERPRGERDLRPDYAAALQALAGWGEDPAIGRLLVQGEVGASLMVEAALAAAHYAPGLSRLHWGFEGWRGHDAQLWDELCEQARQAQVAVPEGQLYLQTGTVGIAQARRTIRSLGIAAPIDQASTDAPPGGGDLLAVCDLVPLGTASPVQEANSLTKLTTALFGIHPAKTAVIARNTLVQRYLNAAPSKRLTGRLGNGDVTFALWGHLPAQDGRARVSLPQGREVPVLVPASDQFAARLQKAWRLRRKWATREGVSCFRVYDADLPDYAAALDVYTEYDPATGQATDRRWLQVAEYAPPRHIDPELAQSRLMDILTLAPQILGIDADDVFLRVRRHAKGGSQYAAEGSAPTPFRKARTTPKGHIPLPHGAHLIDEGGLTFEVNFLQRLDCGIFLDHRDTRARLREMAKQTQGSKRFLNLFAYTGTATCYAADGGMHYTTTVDLSRPSLEWARRNMARNGFTGPAHEYVQADVIRWVQEQRRTRNRWDLVFCDVPTFSNSSKMGRRSFDVQRDHAELLIGVSRLLTRNGVCLFSCNLRSFRPDTDKLAKAGVRLEDITQETIPPDFERNQRIHHAYLVRRVAADGGAPSTSQG